MNGLMYVLSLYFQDPATFGYEPVENRRGDATLRPTAMIAVTPLITPLAARIGTRFAIVAGFGLRRGRVRGPGVRPVVLDVRELSSSRSWCSPVGLGIANGPASSASTAALGCRRTRWGQASGSRTWRATSAGRSWWPLSRQSSTTVTVDETAAGEQRPPGRLRPDLSRAALLMAILSGLGVALVLLMARHHPGAPACSRPCRCGPRPPRTRSRHDLPDGDVDRLQLDGSTVLMPRRFTMMTPRAAGVPS